jgi:hypothetical protein
MRLTSEKYELELVDEPTYVRASADNSRSYDREYVFRDRTLTTSRHGVVVQEGGRAVRSCILLASGGTTTVHERSALIVGDFCFVGVGDTLCALALPSLENLWHRAVDTATCFGVYLVAALDCLITHGECEITRLSLSGEVAWSTSGGDIFTEGFALNANHVEAVDFNGVRYRIDLTTGVCHSEGKDGTRHQRLPW